MAKRKSSSKQTLIFDLYEAVVLSVSVDLSGAVLLSGGHGLGTVSSVESRGCGAVSVAAGGAGIHGDSSGGGGGVGRVEDTEHERGSTV